MKKKSNLAVGSALCVFLISCLPASSPAESSAAAGEKFAAMADQFMKESLALSPTSASQAGYHKHRDASGKIIELDAVLDDMSSEAMTRQRDFYAAWGNRFRTESPPASLGPEDAADWQLVNDQIALQLLEFDQIQNYRHNPTVPVELIGTAIFQLLTEDYAPKDVRIGHILSRISQVPRLLEQVKQYLNDADPVFIKSAVKENAGNVDLIADTVAKEIPASSALKAEYDRVGAPAISALKDFSTWLQDDLGKRPCSRSWRLGKELYDKKFKLVMEAALTPEQLLADAEKDLNSVRAEMLKLALPMYKKMHGGLDSDLKLTGQARENKIIGEVLQKISNEHPARGKLQQSVEADLESIKQFIREKHIVSLSSRENLKVIPTPLFERAIYSVAGFHSAPPLNPRAEAQYWVTPIEPSVPEKEAESRLREYNNYALKWLTIHEALPGHYIQFEHLNGIKPEWRRLLRSLYANGAYVEGWAEYIAQVMMDQGFMNDDPRFRLVMRKIRLRLLANTVLDVKMQTMGMTDQQAMDLMTGQTFQTQAEAEGKLRRAKLSSCQLPTYYVGLREWLQFRHRYQQAAGKGFNLMDFHNRALDEGPLPVPVVEKLVMEEKAIERPRLATPAKD